MGVYKDQFSFITALQRFPPPVPILLPPTRQLWAYYVGVAPEAESKNSYRDPVVNMCTLCFL